MTRESMDVLEKLGQIGRRRRLCLAAEAAGATGVAGCIVAATTAGAMGVQAGNRGVAMAMAAGPIVAGAVVATWGRARRFARPGGAVAAVLIAGGVLGLAAVWGGPIDRVALTAAMVAGALLAGAAPVLAGRVDLGGTARLLDERGDFAERLATAAQVADRAGEDDAAAMVCRQGAAILESGQADRVSLWTRTRATAAAMAVAGLLWVTVLLLPRVGADGVGEGVDLAAMTSQERAELVAKIRAAAAGSKSPAVAVRLAELPAAVQEGDRETVAKILEELRRAGVDVRTAVGTMGGEGSGGNEGGGMLNRKRLGKQMGGTEGAGGTGGTERGTERGTEGGTEGGMGRVAWVGPGNPRVQEGAEEWGAGGTMPYDSAWREAGERAAAALEGGAVPARHRQLVRDFFGVEGR